MKQALFATLVSLLLCLTAQAGDSVIVSRIVGVIDGDTFKVDIDHWEPIVGRKMPVRIRDINCPEMRGPDSLKAQQARGFTSQQLYAAHTVTLRNIRRGKYFRLEADVYVDSLNLGVLLVTEGLAEQK